MKKILVVDKNTNFLQTLISKFKGEFVVLTAATQGEALECLSENPDLALAVVSPSEIGWKEAALLARKIQGETSAEVIALDGDPERCGELIAAGCRVIAPRYFASQTIVKVLSGAPFNRRGKGLLKILILEGLNKPSTLRVREAVGRIITEFSFRAEVLDFPCRVWREATEAIRKNSPDIIFLPMILERGEGREVGIWLDGYWRGLIRVASYSEETESEQRKHYQGCHSVVFFVDTSSVELLNIGVKRVINAALP